MPANMYRGECDITLAGVEFHLTYNFKSQRYFKLFTGRTVTGTFADFEKDIGLMFDPSFALPLIACGMVDDPKFSPQRTERFLQAIEDLISSQLDRYLREHPKALLQEAVLELIKEPLTALGHSMGFGEQIETMMNAITGISVSQATEEQLQQDLGDSPLEVQAQTELPLVV